MIERVPPHIPSHYSQHYFAPGVIEGPPSKPRNARRIVRKALRVIAFLLALCFLSGVVRGCQLASEEMQQPVHARVVT